MKRVNMVLAVFREMFSMIKEHKLYFLAPILIVLAILALVVYYIGPAAVVSFIYAGI